MSDSLGSKSETPYSRHSEPNEGDADGGDGSGLNADGTTSTGKSSAKRISKYFTVRLLQAAVTVTLAVYASILIANAGGAVDELRIGQIREQQSVYLSQSPEFRDLRSERRRDLIDEHVQMEIRRLGLDEPFIFRSFRYLRNALTLDLGRAEYLTSESGSRQVRYIILERLPPTLYLFASGNLILFFLSVFGALFLSRRYGSKLDRAVVALAPTSTAPNWFYGIFLVLIFSAVLGWLPFGGMVASPPPANPFLYFLSLVRHLVLPVTAVVLNLLFVSIYTYRTFFLLYSSEDYVEMAKAKGLRSGVVERRYILRPTLPTIITNFSLSMITVWLGSILLEGVFNWPGLGSLIMQAISQTDTPVIIGSVAIYSYLLVFTFLILDVVYAIVDPRVGVGSGGAES